MTGRRAGFGKCGNVLRPVRARRGFRWRTERASSRIRGMKRLLIPLITLLLGTASALASTIMVVPIFEPLSLHGTDGDEALTEIGEALQAAVMPRPMALTGAFPEVLVDAIRTPHLIPTNNPNYQVKETNLLVLCDIGIGGRMTAEGLVVTFDISKLTIPPEVDLTSRQVLKLAMIAMRKTVEAYHGPQTQPLSVAVVIEGADEAKASLKELEVKFTLEPSPDSH